MYRRLHRLHHARGVQITDALITCDSREMALVWMAYLRLSPRSLHHMAPMTWRCGCEDYRLVARLSVLRFWLGRSSFRLPFALGLRLRLMQ